MEVHEISEVPHANKDCGICRVGISMLTSRETQKKASAQKVPGEGTGDLGRQSVGISTSFVSRLGKDLLRMVFL